MLHNSQAGICSHKQSRGCIGVLQGRSRCQERVARCRTPVNKTMRRLKVSVVLFPRCTASCTPLNLHLYGSAPLHAALQPDIALAALPHTLYLSSCCRSTVGSLMRSWTPERRHLRCHQHVTVKPPLRLVSAPTGKALTLGLPRTDA